MSVFKYRMQNILNIKNKLEEQAKNEFAIANRKVLEEQAKLSALYNRKAALERKARALLEADFLRHSENRRQDWRAEKGSFSGRKAFRGKTGGTHGDPHRTQDP